MPSRKKNQRSTRSWLLPVVGLFILGGIWTAEQFARFGSAPPWLQFLFAATQPSGGLRVGLVAGHSGNDSGAVCPDGLSEADVNRKITNLTAQKLRGQGIRVDVLQEFDPRLPGYRADAFVSIHADSCSVSFSGYKVASQDGGSESSAHLSTCLWDKYQEATGLPQHPETITINMTEYHAFGKLAPDTPAAIIELGFLKADRALLTEQPDRAAQGVANGILCFLSSTP